MTTQFVGNLRKEITTYAKPLILSAGLLIASLSPVFVTTGIAHADINNTRADAWGTQELAGSGWFSGGGVPVYSNGSQVSYTPNKPNNSVNGVVSGEEWQCVELVNRLYLTKGWTTSTLSGNGNTIINDVHNHTGLSYQNNGSISSLNPGDVITLDDGGFGHAGIINTTGSTYQIVNQNTAAVYSSASINTGSLSTSNAHLQMSGWAGYSVQAIIHQPSGSSATTDNTTNWSGNFVSTWGVNRLDAFTPETWSSGSANTDHKWNNGSWQAWDAPLSLGQQISSWPSAVSWGSNRIDLFARDATSSHHLLHAYFDTNGWHNWDSSLGGCITGAPAVSSWGTNRLDVFAQGCGDNGASLNHIWYDGSWHSWETIPISGGQLASAPAAISWGSGRIDVFARNSSDSSLIQTYYDTNGWHNWASLGGCIIGAPGVSSWGTNRLDIFAQGCGDGGANTNHKWYNGSWQAWETLPNSQQITSSPSAVSWSTDRIDLFARNSSGGLNHRYYDTGGWHNWESLGGTLGN